jgi:hypothetical protein
MSIRYPHNTKYYSKFGKKAALLSLLFPGFGQLQCKAYLKGTLLVCLFSFVVALRLILSATPSLGDSGVSSILLTLFPIAVWGISIYDAYRTAIELRQTEATRYNLQIITSIRGFDADNLQFEEISLTKNVSQRGTCLTMSRLLKPGSVLSLDFEGKSRNSGRVIWARETGNYDERLVGMELLTPIKKFDF